MNQPEYVQEPKHDHNNHHRVQNGLDASGHGDKAIHEPEQNSNYDEYGYKVNQGHDRFASFFASRRPDIPKVGLASVFVREAMRQMWSGEEPGISRCSG
jgi:hypothetical protein